MTHHAPARVDPALWLEEALHLLALRLRHEVALTRALRGDGRREGFLGLFLSDGEAEALLDEMSGRLAVEGAAPDAASLAAAWRRHAPARRCDPASIWARLALAFDLAEPELDLLVLAAAPALDPRFGRVYGYLNDDMARRHLTPALAQRLLPWPQDELTLRRMLRPAAPLCRFGLIAAERAVPEIERALRIEERVLDFLLGQPVAPAGTVLRFGGRDLPGRSLLVCGASGAETSLAVLEHAAAEGWDLCLCPETVEPEALRAELRACHLAGLVPVFAGLAGLEAGQMRELAPLLGAGAILVSARPEAWLSAGLCARTLAAGPVSEAARQAWLDRLTRGREPGRVRRLLGNARHLDLLRLAAACAGAPEEAALEIAARGQAAAGLDGLARRIESAQGLDDLVLPRATRAALERLISWQTAAAEVLDDWGLGPVFNKRRGSVALFKGPSGTGKTMAAGVIGNALGLPVFRVDLAAMISKYIGETEKNLERLFRAAEGTDVVLFFDEADAVFGQRSEISDAHDRYANLETSYLLQRLESFDGISILATNLSQNMDPAFLRRIDLVVEFPAPTPAHRRALWGRIGKTRTPLAADVDLDLLAERFELTGGEIRNCWLDAAHRAVAAGCPVGMAQLAQAIGAELIKQGKPLRKSDFGAHYGALRGAGGA
jgi:ATPase family associated with various cellular activities (AAA)